MISEVTGIQLYCILLWYLQGLAGNCCFLIATSDFSDSSLNGDMLYASTVTKGGISHVIEKTKVKNVQ